MDTSLSHHPGDPGVQRRAGNDVHQSWRAAGAAEQTGNGDGKASKRRAGCLKTDGGGDVHYSVSVCRTGTGILS